jgi:hypothetical protein
LLSVGIDISRVAWGRFAALCHADRFGVRAISWARSELLAKRGGTMKKASNWIAVGGAALFVAAVAAVAVANWSGIGDSGIDLHGWIALVLGVLATLALGIGLMALVFISNRRGYDDPPREDH